MIEKLIKYQNDSEKSFENSKSFSTIINYIFALIIFFFSTIVSAFTLPLRFLYKKVVFKKNISNIVHLNDENINSVLKKEKLVLIDFWAEWCGPCLMMNSILEKFANESKNIQIAKVNADLNRKLVKTFQIKGLPQFILLKNGKEIKRYAGAMTISDLTKFCYENR
ncbi:hypothetical protein GCM10022393_39800 [Aquimarina addita]|uniref:Thioredoxin domain-containing protein n=1 Tax=Aquimarina addita TaxID=870485 RepID=A0ABP6UVZ6_9FLAO